MTDQVLPFIEHPGTRFINRELSWLAFNIRVLEEAQNIDNPLLERIKFLSISASNLDEFIMVRVAGLKDQLRNHIYSTSDDGLTASEQLAVMEPGIASLQNQQQRCWFRLQASLEEQGIQIERKETLRPEDHAALEHYFDHNIFSALSPIAVDMAHPFPFLPNLGLAVILQVHTDAPHSAGLAVMVLPETLPRIIRIHKDQDRFILLEEVIRIFHPRLFPNHHVSGYDVIRIIRDGELEIEDEAEDLMTHLESAVKLRRRGRVIHVEVDAGMDKVIQEKLVSLLGVSTDEIIMQDQMLGLRSLMELYELPYVSLKFKPYTERFPERVNEYGGDCFAAIATKDMIVHHPYETFDVVIQFLQQAAADPQVVAIKQTLYRTSNDSPVVKALISAAERGKAVTVVVELKARFDEEANIRWARDLERVGAQVVFGIAELKTHAKVSLVVRREGEQLVSYVHLGTGNYHPVTARSYADLSFFTCRTDICNDAAILFNYLTGHAKPKTLEALVVAPLTFRSELVALIQEEVAHAKVGRPATIWAKMNALVDPDMINALYEASQEGVNIDLVVRGVCVLRPGVKGLSENIRVKSMVGRFLEHARIFCFGAGYNLPSKHAKLYIASGDWMPRNFNSRVEVMVPIINSTVHEQVMGQILLANLKDEKQSWIMGSDGQYTRVKCKEDGFSAHEYFMTNPSLSGRGKALSSMGVRRQREKIHRLTAKNDIHHSSK